MDVWCITNRHNVAFVRANMCFWIDSGSCRKNKGVKIKIKHKSIYGCKELLIN